MPVSPARCAGHSPHAVSHLPHSVTHTRSPTRTQSLTHTLVSSPYSGHLYKATRLYTATCTLVIALALVTDLYGHSSLHWSQPHMVGSSPVCGRPHTGQRTLRVHTPRFLRSPAGSPGLDPFGRGNKRGSSGHSSAPCSGFTPLHPSVGTEPGSPHESCGLGPLPEVDGGHRGREGTGHSEWSRCCEHGPAPPYLFILMGNSDRESRGMPSPIFFL